MKFIQIENRAGKLSLNEVVTPDSINRVISEIEKLYGQKAVLENQTIGEITCQASDALETVEINIHSPGGSVLDGSRLYNAIKEMRNRGVHVTAIINTLAASMGSVIAMAADKVQIVKGGRIMIHEASQGIHGTSEDHARAAKNLDEISEEIAGIYAEKTGATTAEMRDLMKKETWMGADEAVKKGFADEVLTFLSNTKPDIEKNQSPETMGLFTNKSDSQTAVIALEAENAELRESFTALQAAAAESAERVVALRTEVSSLTDEVTTTKAELVTATDDLTAANEKLATFDEKVEAAAQAKFECLGGPPIPASSKDESSESAMTRSDFKALGPRARLDFVLAGGKIS